LAEDTIKPYIEWFKQAEYDLETAEALFSSGKFIYTIFMCHLSIEKALKGLYSKNFQKSPPKTHNLNYLYELIQLNLEEDLQEFIDILNDLSVPTRYPDELERLLKDYDRNNTQNILERTKVLLSCLKKKL
jgi:HEPN domain-containing protein